jgi:predicted  nucleic acid-binding Zn-ribbon protein
LLEEVELLLQLQSVDMELADLEDEREHLPGEIESLAKEKQRSHDELVERESALEEARKARARRERDLEDATAKINDLRSKQIVIKTNAEYAALTHEIDFMKKEISDIEESILTLLEEIESATADVEQVRERATQADAQADEKIRELRVKVAELDDQIAVKKDERLRISKRVDKPLLTRYDRILASKGDCAVVNVSDGACSGCYKSLPPQTVLEVKRARDLIECDGCGRILYWSLETDSG